jgi:hypothetical protein
MNTTAFNSRFLARAKILEMTKSSSINANSDESRSNFEKGGFVESLDRKLEDEFGMYNQSSKIEGYCIDT